MEACPARLRTTGWSLSSCEYCFSFSGWPRLRRGRPRSRARSRARRRRVGGAPEIDVLHEYVALVEGELLDDAAHRGILDLVQPLRTQAEPVRREQDLNLAAAALGMIPQVLKGLSQHIPASSRLSTEKLNAQSIPC